MSLGGFFFGRISIGDSPKLSGGTWAEHAAVLAPKHTQN